MLKIRLQRTGRRNNAAFRLIVAESTQGPKSGKHVEILGSYNPHSNTRTFKTERVQHWISRGAQVSDTAHNLLVTEKVIKGKKKNVLPRKSPMVKEASSEAAPAETSADATEAPVEDEKQEELEEVQTDAPEASEAGTPQEEKTVPDVVEETEGTEEKKEEEKPAA